MPGAAIGRITERSWLTRLVPSISAVAGAAVAAIILLVVRPAPAPEADVAAEAVGDHLRVLGAHALDVETNDMHNVKPWFAGKLDFTPPVSFLGDDEFQLKGGSVAVFLGHKAATFVWPMNYALGCGSHRRISSSCNWLRNRMRERFVSCLK